MFQKTCDYILCEGLGSWACTNCKGKGTYYGFDFKGGMTIDKIKTAGRNL